MKSSIQKLFSEGFPELAARLLIGALFTYAAIHKIAFPAAFAKILYGYALFPEISINLLALIVPWLELFAGIGLLVGFRPRAAALLITVLLFSFVIALSINLFRGHEFDCGCFSFGAAGSLDSIRSLLVRDIVCLFLALWIFGYRGRRRFCFL